MLKEESKKPLTIITILLALLTLAASLTGILKNSIYKPFTPDKMMPGAMSQDIISLLAAILLLFCLTGLKRGSLRVLVFWAGLLGYLFYGYALYAFGGIYNILFLPYLAILSLSIFGLIIFFSSLQWNRLNIEIFHKIPRKTIAWFFLFISLMFAIQWFSMILVNIKSSTIDPGTIIFVLDLTMVLPFLVITALGLFRRRPIFYLFAGVLLIKAGTLGLSVFIGQLLLPLFNVPFEMFFTILFFVLTLGSFALTLFFFKGINDHSKKIMDN